MFHIARSPGIDTEVVGWGSCSSVGSATVTRPLSVLLADLVRPRTRR